MVFVPAPQAPAPPVTVTARCPCCGLRAKGPALGDTPFCPGKCVPCGGPCLGQLQREAASPSPSAPPLARRPVEDANWVMRN